jgi:hypothetical protein
LCNFSSPTSLPLILSAKWCLGISTNYETRHCTTSSILLPLYPSTVNCNYQTLLSRIRIERFIATQVKWSSAATRHEGAWGGEEYTDLGTTLGEWSASRPSSALPPGKGPPVPTGQEAGWAL